MLLAGLLQRHAVGKQTEKLGDHLEASNPVPDQSQIERFLGSPTQEAALSFIGGAGSCRLYHEFAAHSSELKGISHPRAFVDIGRKTHASDGGTSSDLTIAITYLDNNAKELQTATLGEMGSSTAEWQISEWVTRNNKGDPVQIPRMNLSMHSTYNLLHSLRSMIR